MSGVLGVIALALLSNGANAAPFEADGGSVLSIAPTNGRTMDVEFADLDNDGDLDAVGAAEFGQNFVMLFERGRFVLCDWALPQGVQHDSEDIAVADFNGDGLPDVFIVSEDDQTNEYYLSRGLTQDGDPSSLRFRDASEALPPAGVGGVSNAVAAADVDGDGDQDLLIGNAGSPSQPGANQLTGGQNVLLLNKGDGTFIDGTGRLPTLKDRTQDIEFGDIDADGDLDVVIANEDANRLLLNDGQGRFTDATAQSIGIKAAEETREADFGDVDGDGDLDLYFANVAWTGLRPQDRLLLHKGDGTFEEAIDWLPTMTMFSLDVDFADLDGDGDLDAAIASIVPGGGPPITLLENNGSGFKKRSDWVPAGMVGNSIDVEIHDVNGDGTPDIYIGNHGAGDWLLIG